LRDGRNEIWVTEPLLYGAFIEDQHAAVKLRSAREQINSTHQKAGPFG
jgi:hypothetical protein